MITYFGLNNRGHIAIFQQLLIQQNLTKDAKKDSRLSTEILGRNWGGFIYEKNNKKLLVLIDTDDGSGGTPFDCKISWPAFDDILQSYKPDDYIILKSQINIDPEFNQFYPFKNDVYQLGIFSDNPYSIFKVKSLIDRSTNQDIDVFFSGGLKFKDFKPCVWPKERDIKKWYPGASMRGYKKLLEIRDRRQDLNIKIFDKVLEPKTFYDLINRSKICIDFPGVGLSSRKFYEYLVLGKCVLTLKQQLTPWPCEENIHYCSMGVDLDFSSLEEKIDFLLKNDTFRKNIESNVFNIEKHLTLESMIKRVEKIINDKIDSLDQNSNPLYVNIDKFY